jgi:hypothetical protein
VFRKELPFAGYSVVKDLPAYALRAPARQARDFRRSLGYSFTGLPSRSLASCEASGEAKAGGEYRARTGDLLVANQALSQLS